MIRLRAVAAAAMVSCAVAGSACARAAHPAYPRNFSVAGQIPRVMWTSEEIAVPVGVLNTGTLEWNPASVHLSYHWRWLFPRELLSPRRQVPFHEGIRTELGAPVSAGAVANVQGRILSPTVPGLYWLEWDMVEEQVTWFGQVAPRQSWRLVVVLPPLYATLTPLPLIFALAGLWLLVRLGRGRRVPPLLAGFAATSDVWWCTAVLWAKPLHLVDLVPLHPTPAGLWLIAAGAVLPPVVLMLLLPRRARVWTLLALGTLASVVVLGDIIYFRFFGDLLSAPALLGAEQTGEVWSSIRSLWSRELTWLVLDLPCALGLAIGLTRTRAARVSARTRVSMAFAVAGIAAGAALSTSAPSAIATINLDQFFSNTTVANRLGPFGFHVYDAWNYAGSTLFRPRASGAQMEAARAWFARRAPLRSAAGPYGGAAAGRNLIVIQVESMQDFVVDLRVGGQEVMPHLRRWVEDGVRFTNVTDQTNEGRTSDAEFTAFTSLLPLDQGAVAFHYPGNHYVGVPGVLAAHGYRTLSAVPFHPGFWNRAVMHPSYGFQQSLFDSDFVLTEQIGWGLDDKDFLRQMVPRLEQMPRPFAAWLITLSLHHPYDEFPAEHKELKLGALEDTPLGNYIHAMHFFDEALDELRSALAHDGLLDDSVIAVYGDHDAGFPRTDETAAALGFQASLAAWTLFDRVPFFIRVPSRGGEVVVPTGTRGVLAGQTDFGPTLLALLGIDTAPLPYLGRNLLGDPGDPPLLRPRGDWIDDRHLFFANGPANISCFDVTAALYADRSQCDDEDASARSARAMSHLVIVSDLQQRLRDALRENARE